MLQNLAFIRRNIRSMVRAYAKVAGIALILIAATNLLSGIGGFSLVEDVLYLATGSIFVYASFRLRNSKDTRYMVGGMGALYLLAGVFVLALVFLFDLPLGGEDYYLVDDLLHTVFGAISLLVAALLPCADAPSNALGFFCATEYDVPARDGGGSSSHRRKKTVTTIPMKAASKNTNTKAKTTISIGNRWTAKVIILLLLLASTSYLAGVYSQRPKVHIA